MHIKINVWWIFAFDFVKEYNRACIAFAIDVWYNDYRKSKSRRGQ